MSRARIFLLPILFLSAASSVVAQDDSPTISAGRPGMATGTDICPAGKLQWETGVGLERNSADDSDETTWTLNTNSLRFGLSEFAELQFGIDARCVKSGGEKVTGVAPIVLGSKLKMLDAKGWLPETSFLATLTLPTGKSEFQADNAAPAIYLLFHNDLSDRVGLDYNVGAEWDGSSSAATTFLTACLGLELSKGWGIFVESYNYFARHADPECYADFGVTFIPHRRIQLDLSTNVSFNDFSHYLGVGLGFSWLIN